MEGQQARAGGVRRERTRAETSSIQQHPAAPGSTQQHLAAPSSTQQQVQERGRALRVTSASLLSNPNLEPSSSLQTVGCRTARCTPHASVTNYRWTEREDPPLTPEHTTARASERAVESNLNTLAPLMEEQRGIMGAGGAGGAGGADDASGECGQRLSLLPPKPNEHSPESLPLFFHTEPTETTRTSKPYSQANAIDEAGPWEAAANAVWKQHCF
ncbi:hypothetical protein GQ43DRAFT_428303 [Delitschia confertaspora ATCC 74209]|uniref:Uncharacterized protein n=1 Tax=Delitschia confertaspora ATCC 74209 TaxID=1513339 RepID=A0A9P4MVZ4_9PLEO|nr:hypothetical protein GQ43DRAFT_428303 [Delitschia confertaspora ATCC 74209]